MQTCKSFFIAGVFLLMGCLVWWWSARDEPITAKSAVAAAAVGQTANDKLATSNTAPAQAYNERQQFEADIKTFLREAKRLGAADRSAHAARLQTQLNNYESNKQLSAAEAYTLKTAMIKATVNDELTQAEALAELAERYRQQAELREAQWVAEQQSNPQFQTYKTRENQVIAQVMSMQNIPGEITREEYLRQRLEEEREKAYR